ncbi:Uncharacterized protein BM_BM1896 [Brugia malayi]|uniref:BMA-NHR-23, isoform a; BMA-NHR-23, isoform b n=2 Tax=Brugia malayi TaxID=6279 RepID=A0A4E9FII7_BRUMA|nr:Uncharacterized protein BM_BM1896 [Brugia malayi]VIO96811.1 Uncharacterized protein BM_BM1896 [Brugia malayi]
MRVSAQIEVIPCKVCGDKSSGVHYGVITCEGCKGFFRRSQSTLNNYQCPRQQKCIVDRVNRNRCQYCRLKKCLELGMSRDAVKFGRMSKKQREKVEDEVRMHKQMAEVQGIAYSPYGEYSPPAPVHPAAAYSNSYEPSVAYAASSYATSATSYAAAAPVSYPSIQGQGYSIAQQAAVPAPSGGYPQRTVGASQPDEDLIAGVTAAFDSAHGLTTVTAADRLAAASTSTFTEQQYRNMNRFDAWKKFAAELTRIIQCIIEFAKMVEGFMQLSQEEQIALLKGCVFELAAIVVTRHYNPETTSLILSREVFPASIFRPSEQAELNFFLGMHSCIHELAQLRLTNAEMGLLSAWILLDRSSLGQFVIEQFRNCLQQQIATRIADSGPLMQKLCEIIQRLRGHAQEHIRLLGQLFTTYPQATEKGALPDLYKELFSPPSS